MEEEAPTLSIAAVTVADLTHLQATTNVSGDPWDNDKSHPANAPTPAEGKSMVELCKMLYEMLEDHDDPADVVDGTQSAYFTELIEDFNFVNDTNFIPNV